MLRVPCAQVENAKFSSFHVKAILISSVCRASLQTSSEPAMCYSEISLRLPFGKAAAGCCSRHRLSCDPVAMARLKLAALLLLGLPP